MKNILKKTMIFISVGAVLLFSGFSVLSIHWISHVLRDTIDERAAFEAAKCANQMGMVLENAEGTVDTMCAEIGSSFDLEMFREEPAYLEKYMGPLSEVVETALVDVNDAAGLYVTFDPQLTDYEGAYEVWYSLDKEGNPVSSDATANGVYLEAFQDYDAPYMQYYFQAVEDKEKGVWTDPGMDPDIKQSVYTYSRAVYVDDVLIGVVGTDIYTEHTNEIIRDMDVKYDGEVFLLNGENQEILSSGKMTDVDTDSLWESCSDTISRKVNATISADADKTGYLISFSRLSNGWTLAIINKAAIMYSPVTIVSTLVVLLAAILAALTILIFYLALHRYMTPVEKATQMLRMMDLEQPSDPEITDTVQDDEDIELLVRRQLQRQREKDLVLAHQSRLAQTGEMMANITHQWKQPLNKLSILLGNLRDSKAYGDLTDEKLERAIERSEEIISSMSTTLNDFRDYLSPDVKREYFSVTHTIQSVFDLLEDRLKLNGIVPAFDRTNDFRAFGYRNALYHVLLNVINNAVEALETANPEKKVLQVDVHPVSDSEMLRIDVFNNGGEIPETVMEQIFKPYITTKEKQGGSGLGLAISRRLVEDSMEGSISLDNQNGGVICHIEIRGGEQNNG